SGDHTLGRSSESPLVNRRGSLTSASSAKIDAGSTPGPGCDASAAAHGAASAPARAPSRPPTGPNRSQHKSTRQARNMAAPNRRLHGSSEIIYGDRRGRLVAQVNSTRHI